MNEVEKKVKEILWDVAGRERVYPGEKYITAFVNRKFDELSTLIQEERQGAVAKCAEIAESDDYYVFLKNDIETAFDLADGNMDKVLAIRKQARKEVADKIRGSLKSLEDKDKESDEL